MKSDLNIPVSRRPPALQLPADADEANAALLGFVRGDDCFVPSTDVEAMRARIAKLQDPMCPDSLNELARHLPTLEMLWLRFAAEAVASSSPDIRAKYLKMALHAQQAYARTFTLVRGLSLQQRDAARVIPLDDGSDD